MTKPNDIIEAINGLLCGLYPDEMVYVNLCPKDFKRPSSLIELVETARTDANKSTVRMNVEIDVTGFVKTEGNYRSDTEKLVARQNGIMGLFECGYIKVGDRCIAVDAVEGAVTFTDCTVELSFEYYDDRAAKGEPPPPADRVNTNLLLED